MIALILDEEEEEAEQKVMVWCDLLTNVHRIKIVLIIYFHFFSYCIPYILFEVTVHILYCILVVIDHTAQDGFAPIQLAARHPSLRHLSNVRENLQYIGGDDTQLHGTEA